MLGTCVHLYSSRHFIQYHCHHNYSTYTTYTQRVVALYLHELSLLQEPPARRQYAWDTLPCQAVLDCQHFLEVFMLSYVLIDV